MFTLNGIVFRVKVPFNDNDDNNDNDDDDDNDYNTNNNAVSTRQYYASWVSVVFIGNFLMK